MTFVHEHCHSEFSLLDGAQKIPDMVKRAADLGMPAIAVTDHGWLAGAVKLVKECKKRGIKPIIGSELYVASGESRLEPARNGGDNFHLTVLAATQEGYRNLSRLSSIAHMDGLHFKPRIDLGLLADHAEGLILFSGCIGAAIPQAIIGGNEKAARTLAEFYAAVFPDRFFIEVMCHGSRGDVDHVRVEDDNGNVLIGESELNDALVSLGDRVGVGLVATNDAHYLVREDGDAHDTLLCLGMGGWKDKEDRLRFPGAEHQAWEFYLKSEEEMRAANKARWWQRACDNTAHVASLVQDSVLPLGQPVLPKFEVPEDDVGFRVFRDAGEIL